MSQGLSFERVSDEGDVTIAWGDKTLTVPENEWASVLAAVCKSGETGETWQAARDYHGA